MHRGAKAPLPAAPEATPVDSTSARKQKLHLVDTHLVHLHLETASPNVAPGGGNTSGVERTRARLACSISLPADGSFHTSAAWLR